MSDSFAICNGCNVENTLVDIQAMYQQAFTKENNELIESYFFCLTCKNVQLKKETKYRNVEYGVD